MGPELMAGHYAAWNYFQSVQSEANSAFISRFRLRFGATRVLDDPMEAAYIGVKLWVQALSRSGTLDLATVKTVLAQQSLDAPEGIVSVDADTRHLWKQVRIGKARTDGQFDIIWQSGHSIAPAPFPFFIPFAELDALSGSAR